MWIDGNGCRETSALFRVFILSIFALVVYPACALAVTINNCGAGGSQTTNNTLAILFATAVNQNGPGGGCTTVNGLFTVFNETAHTGASGPQTNNDLNVLGTVVNNSYPPSFTSPTTLQLLFTPGSTAATDWTLSNQATPSEANTTITTTFVYSVSIDQSVLGPQNSPYHLTNLFGNFDSAFTNVGAGDQVTVTTTVCPNTTTFSAGCAGQVSLIFDNNNGTITGTGGNVVLNTTQAAIQEMVSVSLRSGAGQLSTAQLNSFTIDFTEAASASGIPEPSSLAMFAGAGAILMFLRRKGKLRIS